MKQMSPSELIQNGIFEISIKDSDQDQQYPSLNSKDMLNQSIFADDGELNRIGGLKRSSFSLQESFNDNYSSSNRLSESFSALNTSTKDEYVFKSRLQSNKNEARQNDYPNEKDIWNLNQSVFSQKVGKQQFKFNRKSEDKQQFPVQNQPLQMEPIEKEVIQTAKKQLHSNIKVILRSTNYFLENIDGDSLLVNGELLRDLYDEFFNRELYIPLFKYERFDEWNSSKDKFNHELEAHRIFKIGLERYVQYIDLKFPQEFQKVFKVLLDIQRGKISKKRQQISFSFFSFDFAMIVELFKNYISSPKTQLLRKALLAKIRALSFARELASKEPNLKNQVQLLEEKKEKQWIQFGQVQLLLFFQQTEYYCSKKIENSPELKFRQVWIKYRDLIRAEKASHAEKFLKSILI